MSKPFDNLSPQPFFPLEDLTDNNRDILSHLSIRPGQVLEYSVEAREKSRSLLVGSQAVKQVAMHLLDYTEPEMKLFDLGVDLYDAVHLLVGAPLRLPPEAALVREREEITKMLPGEARLYVENSYASLMRAPATTHVVNEAVPDWYKESALLVYVRAGAALARQFESECVLL